MTHRINTRLAGLALAAGASLIGPHALAAPAVLGQPGRPAAQANVVLRQLAVFLAELGVDADLAAARVRLGLTDELADRCAPAARACERGDDGCREAAVEDVLSCARDAGLTEPEDHVFRATGKTGDGGRVVLYGTLGAPIGRPALASVARSVER
ncbi:MAG: hypothetical protein H6702_09930 [Myxococcales bacterium]|nr:hypothetical protein [Myxococcales bacterium]